MHLTKRFDQLPKGQRVDEHVTGPIPYVVETEEGTVEQLVETDEDGHPKLTLVVGYNCIEYGCTLRRFSPEDQEWLVEVIGRQIDQAYRQGFREGAAYVRDPIKAALGIRERR